HHPPELVELQPPYGDFRHKRMAFMRRIERAAEQPHRHALFDMGHAQIMRIDAGILFLERRKPEAKTHQLRICPLPRTRYLNEVSCSTPTGPRACILPVAMPISAPMPNSPPSANCVEALCRRMAESIS